MKKKVVGLMVSVLTMGALSLTALAVPNYNCYTSITNAGRTATGVTTCSVATYCSVTVTGYYGYGLVLCQDLVQVKMRNFSPF